MADPFIGEIRIFGCDYAPRDWSKCQGQILNISSNYALFSLLGPMYGGDARTTFNLPDLRGRAIKGQSTNSNLSHMGGSEAVTLTTSEIPAHSHTVKVPVSEDLFGSGTEYDMGYMQKTSTNNVFSTKSGTGQALGFTLSQVGGNQAHENRQPYLVLNYCIAIGGLYPSRS